MHKKPIVVFSSILMLSLAIGTAWANAPIVSAAKVPPRQPVPIGLENGSAWLRPNENNTNSIRVRTGVFDDAQDQVATRRPVPQVHMGVFWTPQGYPGELQRDSLGNIPHFGFLGPADDHDGGWAWGSYDRKHNARQKKNKRRAAAVSAAARW